MAPLPDQMIYCSRKLATELAAEFPAHLRLRIENTIMAATLSGLSLAAHYLVANDGHPGVSPQILEQAADEVAKRLGFKTAQLPPETPKVP